MIDRSKYNPQGFVHKSVAIDPGVQNSLKKLKIFKTSSAIKVPEAVKMETPKSILKSGVIPSICAVGASLKSNNYDTLNRTPGIQKLSATHIVDICDKKFRPQNLTVERGDSVEFVVNPANSSFNKYVICVADIEESDLLTSECRFKTQFTELGQFTIKCLINYEMKAKVEVVVPRPKTMEWEEPVIPKMEGAVERDTAPALVNRVFEKASTDLETIKDKSLTQKLNQVLASDENLEHKSLSRKELEATFKNYSPVIFGALKEEIIPTDKKSEEDKTEDEAEEHKFLEQQRNSSMSSRAKSRSNKHTPESDKNKDTSTYNVSSKCFSKLDFTDTKKEDINHNKISEEDESVEETQYSQSVGSVSTYKPINKQSPF